MIMKYKIRELATGTKGWYQTDTADFKKMWGYVKHGVVWCVVKLDNEDFYHYYHCNSKSWTKLPLTANYNFHK